MGIINDFIPMKIDQTVGNTPRQVITAERWNELFNLNITQGDHSETWLQSLVDAHNILVTDTNAALALKSDKSVTNQHYKLVTFNANNGTFTFTREDGSFTTVDTALEKVATNWQYDPITQELVLTLVDGSTQRVSLSAFITENEFVDSSTVVFSVANHKVTAGIKPGSLNDTHLTSAFVASLQNYVTQAQASATAAVNSATDAAASAALASNRATAASGSATSAATSKDAAATYSTNASNAATAAGGSATAAAGSAGAASASAAKSESWAVGGTGTRPGEDTNNAKYWAGKAEQIIGGDFATKTEAQAYAATAENNAKADLTTHAGDTVKHITAAERTAWNGKAAGSHTHAPTDLSSAVPINKGGTGVTTAAEALAALGAAAAGDLAAKRPNIIRTLPIAAGNTVAVGDVVDVVGGAVISGKAAVGTLAVGSTAKLVVGGAEKEFIVLHQGKPSAVYSGTFVGTTTLMMKDLDAPRQLAASAHNSYADSTMHTYLNSTFLSMFEATIQASIRQVKIPYRPGSGASLTVNSGENGLSAKVWLLSGYEVGLTSVDGYALPAEGAKLDYFLSGTGATALDKRKASNFWWLRSPYCRSGYDDYAQRVSASGDTGGLQTTNPTPAPRPCISLDSATPVKVGQVTPSQTIALQSGTAGQSIDIIFDGVAELPGITAGTQITSAGVTGYAPQDGWLWVRPAWDKKPFVTGMYVGNDAASREISLGFKPSAVLLYRFNGKQWESNTAIQGGLALDGYPCWGTVGNNATRVLEVTTNGFNVFANGAYYSNQASTNFYYIAFR